MVVVAAAVITHRGLDRIGHNGAVIREQFFDALRRQFRRGFQRLVQIRDVGLMMLSVVDLHRLRVDMGLQRVEGVGQCG
jgi:hypothetical protein